MVFQMCKYVNGNGKDLVGMGGIVNTENHSDTSLVYITAVTVVVLKLIYSAVDDRRSTAWRT